MLGTQRLLVRLRSPYATLTAVMGTVLLFGFEGLYRPANNFDALMYDAAARSFTTNDPVEIHREAYADMFAAVPSDRYEQLLTADEYRRTLAADPEAFRQNLRHYRYKILYVSMVYVAGKAGFNRYRASFIISCATVAAGLLIFFAAFRNEIDPVYWFALPLIIVATGVHELAKLGTPDAIVFLLTSLAWLAIVRRKPILLVIAAIGLVVTRLDLAILSILFMALLLTRKQDRIAGLGGLALVVALALIVYMQFQPFGWSYAFHPLTAYPEDAAPEAGLADYLRVLKENLPVTAYYHAFIVNLFIVFLTYVMAGTRVAEIQSNAKLKLFLLILAVLNASMLGRFIIVPFAPNRFFAPVYFSGYLCLLVVAGSSYIYRLPGRADIPDGETPAAGALR